MPKRLYLGKKTKDGTANLENRFNLFKKKGQRTERISVRADKKTYTGKQGVCNDQVIEM